MLEQKANSMSFILDILFPKKCVGCRRRGGYFCQDCVYSIMQKDLICPGCERVSVGGKTHPKCIGKYGLDGLWSLGAYQGRLKLAIKALKYKFLKQLGNILVNVTLDYWVRHEPYFLEEIEKNKDQKWIVTSVPLYWLRENKRGFNQSSLIGKQLAQKLGLKYLETLKKVKYTKSQVELDEDQRKENIKNAFQIKPNYELRTMDYVLLVDDVWTTGSTLKECCYVLKRAGAKKVWALTLAR